MNSNVRGIALGLLVAGLLFVVSLVAVHQGVTGGATLQYLAFVAGGFVTARVSKTHQLALSAALALPAVALGALITWAWIVAGLPADNVGLAGTIIFAVLSLPVAAALCLIGGGLSVVADRWMPPNKSLERTREG